MRIDVQGRDFRLTGPLLEHAQRRLSIALTRIRYRITRVVVRLGDANGPRGGEDKFCRVRVCLENASPVLIEESCADLYAAIDRAAERAGRNAARRVERLREKPRRNMPTPPVWTSGAFDTTTS